MWCVTIYDKDFTKIEFHNSIKRKSSKQYISNFFYSIHTFCNKLLCLTDKSKLEEKKISVNGFTQGFHFPWKKSV